MCFIINTFFFPGVGTMIASCNTALGEFSEEAFVAGILQFFLSFVMGFSWFGGPIAGGSCMPFVFAGLIWTFISSIKIIHKTKK